MRLICSPESDESNRSSGSSTTSGTRSDGTRSETGSWWNSDSSKSSNVSCLRSFGLSFDDQMDYDESELEVQVILVVFTCISLDLAYAYATL